MPGYLLSTLSKEVLATVTVITTTLELWVALAGMFSSQSLSHVNNIRTALINMQKGNQSVRLPARPCYLLSTALDFPEEERMMQQSSISISLSF